MKAMHRLLLTMLLLPGMANAMAGQLAADDAEYRPVDSADYRSVIKLGEGGAPVHVAAFQMMSLPVTNADFLAFVTEYPKWRRDQAPSILVDSEYLSHWVSADQLADGQQQQPVTRVSWFAASAYCSARGARLPSWSEWELAAAADETRRDARDDPAWRERILGWYSQPSGKQLAEVGIDQPNAYGLHNLHGLVWEWVDDFNALFVASDSRKQGDPDLLKFCGAGAISMNDRENYAVLMRIAMLSSMNAGSSTRNLGFRCVHD